MEKLILMIQIGKKQKQRKWPNLKKKLKIEKNQKKY